jgi:hypothetical protein
MKPPSATRRLFFGIMVGWLCVLARPAEAQVDIHIGIPLPPPLIFSAPPLVVVLPETYVYVVPDIDEDVFFFDGWWWRQWQGRWYRSHYYDRSWDHYSRVPSFYGQVPHEWRHEYREHRWRGRSWNYERVPHEQVERNWKTWKHARYWEHHQTWGVQGLRPQAREHGRPHQAPQSERRGRQPHVQQPERHGQQPHVRHPEHGGQQRPAREQQSRQPTKRRGHQAQGHPDHGQGHGQGNRGQERGKAAQQHGGKGD